MVLFWRDVESRVILEDFAMEKPWEDLKDADEKANYLKEQVRRLWAVAVEMASSQRRLNDRVVKLEEKNRAA